MDIAREVKNALCLEGHLDETFKNVLASESPDGVSCLLTALAHKAVDMTMSAVSEASPMVEVGKASLMPGTSAFTMAVFNAADVPENAKLYAASEEAGKHCWLQVGVGPCDDGERVNVVVHLRQGSTTFVLYARSHGVDRDTFGYGTLDGNIGETLWTKAVSKP